MSLAVRITVAATGVVGLTLAVAAVLLVTSLRIGLLQSVDEAAEQRAADLGQLVAGGTVPALLPQVGDLTEAQVIGPDGAVLSSTPALAGEPALVDVGRVSEGVVDADELRLLVVRGDPYTVIVGSPLGEIREVTTRLSLALATGVPVLLVVLAGIVLTLVRYALRTVDRLRRQVDTITATDLHRRVDTPAARDEVRALAVTMNELLERLDEAAAAQRRFVADAAHELRSPLAALHAQLEVGLRQPDPTRLGERLPGMLEDTARLARLVDDLLALARLDETSRVHRHQLLDLDEVVFAQVGQLRHHARVPIRTTQVCAGLVRGDPDLLSRVVRNLLDNAVRYATTRVEVSLTSVGDAVVLTVADDGPGIPPADAQRVFHRFERLQQARDRDSGGSGLGLAIVHDAVRASGGSVGVEQAGPGARLVVRLPAADAHEPVADARA
ncbi:MAG: ATP-binding protein [Mycobacteriales bacterium]